MATADKVVVELQAKTDAYIANVTKADAVFTAKVGHMEKEVDALSAKITSAGSKSGQAFTKIANDAPRAANAVKSVNVQMAQLPAQLNDIAAQLAGGQSPFLIAIQQGSQINQALGSAGAGGAVRALGAAFGSLVNPVGLATFAIIGLGGAAVQYFASMLSDGAKAELTLEQQAKLISAVADRWGDAVPALKAYADQLKRAKEVGELTEATQAAINQEFETARKILPELKTEIGGIVKALLDTVSGQKQADELRKAFNELDVAAQDLNKALQEGKNVGEAYREFQEKLAALQASRAVVANESLAKSVNGLAAAYDGAVSSARVLAGETEKLIRLYEGKGELLRRGLADLILPDTAPAPGRLGVDDAAVYGDFRGDAHGFLRTRANVAAEKIDLIVDELAEPLARLLSEFPDVRIESAFRTNAEQRDIWARSGGGTRFPAARPGNSRHERGAAVDLTGPSRDTEAFLRRARELGLMQLPGDRPHFQLIGGTGGEGTVSSSTRAPKKTPADLFKGDVAAVQARIDLLNAEIEAQSKLNPLINDYGYAVKKAEIEQKLLNEAKRAGLEITPALAAQIDQLATNYAKLESQQKRNQAANQRLVDSAQEFSDLGRDILGGFINDLRAGKSGAEALAGALDKIADKLLNIGLDALFGSGGKNGGFGIIGKLFGFAKGTPNTGGSRNQVRGVVHGQEAVIPLDSGGKVPISIPSTAMPSRNASNGRQNVNVTVGLDRDGVNIVPVVRSVTVQAISSYDKSLSRSWGARTNDATARQR